MDGTRRTIPSGSGLSVNDPKPAAARLQDVEVRQQTVIGIEERVSGYPPNAAMGVRRLLAWSGATPGSFVMARPEHYRHPFKGSGKTVIGTRQRHEDGSQCIGEIRIVRAVSWWRQSVRFAEQHVKPDDPRTGLAEPIHQLRNHLPRPWPLPVPGQARFIDVDDRRPCPYRAGAGPRAASHRWRRGEAVQAGGHLQFGG